MKTLWIVSGGMEAVPGIQRAKAMGLHVVVSDFNPDAPGFAFADERIIASTYDVDACVQAAQDYRARGGCIDGVISIAADVPLTVASMAAALQLPGIPVETAQLAMDKLAMKQRFVERGVPVPWFSAVRDAQHLRRLLAEQQRTLVIKPVDSRGARGVLRLTPEVDLDWAFAHAQSQSPTQRVMVEEYLAGPQISTESILLADGAATPGFVDRNYELLESYAPHMIENGGQQPSILDEAARRAVADCAVAAGRALGVEFGVVKGDMVWTEQGPKVIEIATRLSGGWLATDQIPLGTGVDFVGMAIRLALAERVAVDDIRPRKADGVAIRYFFPPAGRVRSIQGAEAFAQQPWVYRLGFFVGPGDALGSVTNHTQRAGFVITTGADRDEAVARARQVVAGIQIATVPL